MGTARVEQALAHSIDISHRPVRSGASTTRVPFLIEHMKPELHTIHVQPRVHRVTLNLKVQFNAENLRPPPTSGIRRRSEAHNSSDPLEHTSSSN